MTRKYRLTTITCTWLVALLCGIGLARSLNFTLPVLYILVACGFTIIAYKKRRFAAIVSVALFGLSLGLWRGSIFYEKLSPYRELTGEKVTLQVQADSSAIYGKASQLEFDASHITVLEPYQVKMSGMMVISGYGENSVLRGDIVTVTGKLYARRGSKIAGISYGQLRVVTRSASILERLRRNFLAGLTTALPEPHNQFAAGLLIGQRSELSAELTTVLRTVGLSHVIAVSGYNLTIMAEVARRKMGKKSKYRSTLLSVGLILLFIAIAGSSASIARAAFVSLLTVFAAHYGRSIKPLTLILLAAGYTSFMNPLNLWVDVGWYLSFLAFFGVLLVAPAIERRYFSHKKPSSIVKLVLETSSAQLMTVPIVMYIFGEVSLIALVANILVVPLVPLAMLLSVIAGFAGMLAPTLAGVIAWPAKELLGFMLAVCSLLARIPHALGELKITAGVMILLYALVILLVIVMRRRSQRIPEYAKI